jgi:RNA-binding protein YhbY
MRSGIVWFGQDAMPQSVKTVTHVFDGLNNHEVLKVRIVPWIWLAQVFLL